MSDVDRDPQVAHLLNEVGATVAPHLTPPGIDTVYTTVRHRRRNRVVVAGVLAAALLGGPSVGFALANDGGGDSTPVGGDPSTTAPAVRPSPTPSASATPPAPNGRISLADLKRAKLDLPPWPASASSCEAGDEEIVGQPVYSDVDRDGAEETGALLRCQSNGEFKVFKVMVFDRDAAGKIVTLGQVLETTGTGEPGVAIWKVWGIEAAAGGQIKVDVGDYFPCCGTAPDLPQHQWRTYGWDGERFTQTGGPAEFGPNPKVTNLRVSSGDLAMTRQADGTWRGTVTFTVRNAGPFSANVDVVATGEGLRATGNGWTGWANPPNGLGDFYTNRVIGELASGASRELTLDFTSTSDPSGTLQFMVANMMKDDTAERSYPDKNSNDNQAQATIRAA